MRSAVSSMLSETSDQLPLAFPDYETTAWDHRTALICVSAIGSSLTDETFQRVYERISHVKEVRPVTTTTTTTMTTVAQDGGRKSSAEEPSLNRFRVRYVDSYPVENNDWGEFQKHRQVLGLISVGGYNSIAELEELKRVHQLNQEKYNSTVLDSRLIAVGMALETTTSDESCEKKKAAVEEEEEEEDGGVPEEVLFYQESSFEETLAEDAVDFCTGLFWMLESKRVEEVQKEGKQEKLVLLSTPFEKKDFVGLDLESRVNKKRMFGRYRKNLGDLFLLCDRMPEAYRHYEVAMETLRSCNDWIWLAGALEGVCAISTIVRYYPDPDPAAAEAEALKPKDIAERYKEVVIHCSKYRQAGVIETEASVKAVRLLTRQKNFVVAAEFLQNQVFINLNMTDAGKIRRFEALSRLYAEIGFARKAAFFLRVAAMRCVAPQNPHPDWTLCYSLLTRANDGYSLDLDATTKTTASCGWPALQIQLVQELVGTARRMGDYGAAVSHLTHLLEAMLGFMSREELTDAVKQLNALVAQAKTPIGRVGLYKIPAVTSFSLSPLAPDLAPKSSVVKSSSSVFVFTPRQFGGGGSKEQGDKVSFCWVQNDVAEVCLVLSNPLPVEVKIVNLVLTHEGVDFEAFPSTFSLAASTDKVPVRLLGMPKEPGLLRITGYSCVVLGVPSRCSLGGQLSPTKNGYVVEVVPSLPLLQGTLTALDAADAQGEALEVHLMHGEEVHLELALANVSQTDVLVKSVGWTSRPAAGDSCDLSLSSPEISVRGTERVAVSITGRTSSEAPADGDVAARKKSLHPPRRNKSVESLFNSISLNDVEAVVEQVVVQYEVELKVSYSANEKCDHYRQLTKKLKVFVSPSAAVTEWDVLPSETLNKNYIVLDIENRTNAELEISYEPSKSLVIEPADACRIPLPLGRFAIPAATEGRHRACHDFLRRNVVVEWRTVDGSDRLGRVSLDDLRLSEEMISNLELLPTGWEVKADGLSMKDSGCKSSYHGIGDPVILNLRLSNGFEFPLEGRFCVEVSIDGSKWPDLGEVCVLTQKRSGPLSCEPAGRIEFETIMLPLVQGKFEVECSCELVVCWAANDGAQSDYVTKFPTFEIDVKSDAAAGR